MSSTARAAAELIWKSYARHLEKAPANQDKDAFILNVSGIITQVVVQERNGRDALAPTTKT
jgi:hypothetical protein